MVALAIVGLMMAIVVGSMGRSVERNLKKTSNRLASTIRYLYNKSALEGLYIKLVLDFETKSYWVEATTDPFVMSNENEEAKLAESKKNNIEGIDKDKEGDQAAKPEEETTTGDNKDRLQETLDNKPTKLEPKEAKFSQMDSYLTRPTNLPNGIIIKDLWVEHKKDAVDAGKEAIFFFPNGFVEKAIINLSNEDGDINYSLTTNPLSGKVIIEDHYKKFGEE